MRSALNIQNISYLDNGPYSLSLQPGEICGLSGTSGVGKSQFLRAIADVLPHDGDCFLGGTACTAMSPQEWRKQVALVPAESHWWYDTVAPHFLNKAKEKDPYLSHLIERFGFSLDVLQWQIGRLSTGERQRLSLIRTLIHSPQVLLLDEPTSGLDSGMTGEVEAVVKECCDKGKTSCLWVSHDMGQLARIASRSFQLKQDSLEEQVLCTLSR